LPSDSAACDSIRAILLDIEGTTTPIDFVYKTLFPYARLRMRDFLVEHTREAEVSADIEALRSQYRADRAASPAPPEWPESSEAELALPAAEYALWLMDRDSKCQPLKSLQGKIWRDGYERGELHGEVYADVPPALSRWTQQGKAVAIFSSGSILAQKLLFRSAPHGDLTRFLRAYFDTTTGPKNAPESYSKIAGALGFEPTSMLFISDVTRELDAAGAAGMRTALSVRPGAEGSGNQTHRVIHSFDEIR
jgi:enolase-phosphatase E1